ncbi:MAG: isoprenylcysteine carboxylmethyltransferase family protein [bacterium]
MTILDSMAKTGDWLFRWRGYLPLLLLPIFLVSFIGAKDRMLGDVGDLLWELGCLVVSLFGLAIRIATIGTIASGTSGRNTRAQAARSLNTTGMYSLMRNPLYLGNYFVALGISLYPRAWYLPILVTALFLLYYERIIAREEVFLEEQFGDEFRTWAARTPALIPSLRSYVRSALPFSWRFVLGRESYTLCLIAIFFLILDVIQNLFAERKLVFEWTWIFIALVSFVLFVVLRSLKKAGLLAVSDR